MLKTHALCIAALALTGSLSTMALAQEARRVGGDLFATSTQDNGVYRSGSAIVRESLPEGYPAPTPPGAIEIKSYPSVRRAEVSGSGNPQRGSGMAFFSLFSHIQERDIAMTSPVETDLRAWSSVDGSADGWTMSFLYRNAELGPLGDDGRITVRDTEPVTVVSIGLQGAYGEQTFRRGLAVLNAWLEAQDEWTPDGDPRSLSYNGPSIPDARKWAEIQIPVRPVAAGSSKPIVRDGAAQDAERVARTNENAAEIIQIAITRGVPLFNNGHPEACAAIYEVAARCVLAINPMRLTTHGRQSLNDALDTVSTSQNASEVAWALRSALDEVFNLLSQTKQHP